MKDNKKKLLIWGTGTISEIASFYFTKDSNYEIVGYIEDEKKAEEINTFNTLNVYSILQIMKLFSPKDVEIFIAIGYRKTNRVRQSRFEEIKALGYNCASYISSKAILFSDKIGENCFILENNVIQPFVEIGDNVMLWSGNHIGHHSILENNVFIASHAVISGKCKVGKNTFLGVNCCLHDGVNVGEFSVVGAGSVVGASCEDHSVFSPQVTSARIIKRDVL